MLASITRFLNLLIQCYLNNPTNLLQLTSHSIARHALQHGDRIVTIDYCDVTSSHVFIYLFIVQKHFLRRSRNLVIRCGFVHKLPFTSLTSLLFLVDISIKNATIIECEASQLARHCVHVLTKQGETISYRTYSKALKVT